MNRNTVLKMVAIFVLLLLMLVILSQCAYISYVAGYQEAQLAPEAASWW